MKAHSLFLIFSNLTHDFQLGNSPYFYYFAFKF